MADLMNAPEASSTRPYLIRALYEWCTDNGLTPYVAVQVDDSVQVPREYVKNNEIVLNISFDATSSLKLGNEFIEFKARFGGVARDIVVPVDHVVAIYARENGQGMAFPVPTEGAAAPAAAGAAPASAPASTPAPAPRSLRLARVDGETAPEPSDGPPPEPPPTPPAPQGPRPSLKRVK